MSRRSRRDLWCLLAALPGVATPFLPVTRFIWSDLSPLTAIMMFDINDPGEIWIVLLVAMMFLPIVVSCWQIWRWWCGEPARWARRTIMILAVVPLVAWAGLIGTCLVEETCGRDDEWVKALLLTAIFIALLTAGNIALFVRNRRRRIAAADTAECLLLGSYVGHAAFLTGIVGDLRWGAALIAATILVYVVTIYMRTWRPISRPG